MEEGVKIGERTYIKKEALIQYNCKLGKRVFVERATSLKEGVVMEDDSKVYFSDNYVAPYIKIKKNVSASSSSEGKLPVQGYLTRNDRVDHYSVSIDNEAPGLSPAYKKYHHLAFKTDTPTLVLIS